MKCCKFPLCCQVLCAIAGLSLLVGIIAKATGFRVFGLVPLSYLRFTGICLLYMIAISFVQIAQNLKK